MAEITLEAKPVLDGLDLTMGGNRIVERSDLALVSVATPLGGGGGLESALRDAFSLDLPKPGHSAVAGDMRAIWMAADQMILVFPQGARDANAHVQDGLKGAGYTTDQTHGWVVLEVSGPDTLAALERICPIDLDPGIFPVDAAARTVMEHLGALILRLGADRFLLASASSSAASFAHAVETSYRYVS